MSLPWSQGPYNALFTSVFTVNGPVPDIKGLNYLLYKWMGSTTLDMQTALGHQPRSFLAVQHEWVSQITFIPVRPIWSSLTPRKEKGIELLWISTHLSSSLLLKEIISLSSFGDFFRRCIGEQALKKNEAAQAGRVTFFTGDIPKDEKRHQAAEIPVSGDQYLKWEASNGYF